jgi:NADP-dependent 3-hydroxy acid dehydrogenase YdfG
MQQEPAHWSLKGCRAVDTGATSGIGKATASEFAALGSEVLVVARRAPAVEVAVEGVLLVVLVAVVFLAYVGS